MDENITPFCIGHHETSRPLPITPQTLQAAHEANYDMVTSPITNAHFHSRVLALLSSSVADESSKVNSHVTWTSNASPIQIEPLIPADTPLTPEDSMSQIIATTSTWTDLCSPDPIIADLSKQILKLELTYAAFCGIMYVIIPGPRSLSSDSPDGGIVQYARAVLDALNHGPFMQIYIWLPMIDQPEEHTDKMGDLGPFTRHKFRVDQHDEKRTLDIFGAWATWDVIRSLCKYHPRLCVALSLPRLLPPVPIQSRWYSEPVRIMTLDSSVFSKNAKGYPVLSKPHQALISRLMRLRIPPWFLLCDVGSLPEAQQQVAGIEPVIIGNTASFPTPVEASVNSTSGNQRKHHDAHIAYMRNLQSKQPARTQLERFGAGYQDYLQAPLQPLTVNLESITYEVFEKDPIKYEWYERAVARALHDWVEQGKPTSGPDGRVVVAVVGAGRGPLVTRALQAAEGVDVEIDMWALEKNPNAFVLLQRHNQTTWDNRVNLVKSDMRTWRGPSRSTLTVHSPSTNGDVPVTSVANSTLPTAGTGDTEVDRDWLRATAATAQSHYKVDILISELLGSFADNELSPECLDGVQHLLNSTHGISIPASYSAHLTPIAAPKLHADILNQSVSNPNATETPYVVMLNAVDFLSTSQPELLDSTPSGQPARSQEHQRTGSTAPPPPPVPVIGTAWSFHHPNPAIAPSHPPPTTNAHNARHSTLTFPIANRGTCHGIAGYFETVLYENLPSGVGGKVELSTNPVTMDTKSESMISWFPIFFPLKTPLTIPDNAEATVHMWRQTDDRKVWYEWLVEVFAVSLQESALGSVSTDKARAGTRGKLRRSKVGSSELHSSIKEACLM